MAIITVYNTILHIVIILFLQRRKGQKTIRRLIYRTNLSKSKIAIVIANCNNITKTLKLFSSQLEIGS